MVNIKYLIHHSIIKKQISNITEMGVLNSRSLLQKKNSLYIKNLSSKNYKLILLGHIIILACLDLFRPIIDCS